MTPLHLGFLVQLAHLLSQLIYRFAVTNLLSKMTKEVDADRLHDRLRARLHLEADGGAGAAAALRGIVVYTRTSKIY